MPIRCGSISGRELNRSIVRRMSSPVWAIAPTNSLGLSANASGPFGRAALAVVGELERDGRYAAARQHRANQVGQRLVAVEDVQADHRRAFRSAGLNAFGEIVVGGNGVVLRDRRDHRRGIRQPVHPKRGPLGQQPALILEGGIVVGLRDGNGFRRAILRGGRQAPPARPPRAIPKSCCASRARLHDDPPCWSFVSPNSCLCHQTDCRRRLQTPIWRGPRSPIGVWRRLLQDSILALRVPHSTAECKSETVARLRWGSMFVG